MGHLTTSRRHAGTALATAIGLAGIALATAGPAGASVGCQSTALRIGSLNLGVANQNGTPCTTAASNSTQSAFNTVRILGGATTSAPHSGTSVADVLRLQDDGLVGSANLRILSASAYVSCVDGHPVVVGGSELVGTDAGGLATTPSSLRAPVDLGPLHLNEVTQSGHSATYRALHLDLPGGGVAAGEAQASGNPC